MKTTKAVTKKKSTKEGITPLDLTKGRLVPIDWDLGHFPIFSVGEKRNEKTIEHCFPGGKWVLSGAEHPNFKDADIYWAILKMFEVAEKEGTLCVMDTVESITISGTDLLEYCGLFRNGKNLKRVMHSLDILNRFTVERWDVYDNENRKGRKEATAAGKQWVDKKDTKKRSFRLLSLPETTMRKGHATITIEISRALRAWVKEHQIHIHWKEMQELGSQWSKAIYLYIQSNKTRWIRQDYLHKYLGVIAAGPAEPKAGASEDAVKEYEKKAAAHQAYLYTVAREIKDAFCEISKRGLIRPFDRKRHVHKTKTGRVLYFVQKPASEEAIQKEKENAKDKWVKKNMPEKKRKIERALTKAALAAPSDDSLPF